MAKIHSIDTFGNNVVACYTTRIGGVSKAPYDSFNLALHVGDNQDLVLKNRQILKDLIQIDKICYMNQVHCNVCKYVDNDNKLLTCDSLVTDKRGLAIAVMTADCLPLLLCDSNASIIAAVHCSWRCVRDDIIKNTLDEIHKIKGQSINLKAFIGPCITKRSFEVGSDVFESFVNKNKDYAKAFYKKDESKYMCDLALICTMQLNAFGIFNIENVDIDTKLNTDEYFSYRHDKITGRQASVIALI